MYVCIYVCMYAMLRGEGSDSLYLIGFAFRTGAALPAQVRLTKLNLVVILPDIITWYTTS